MWMGIVDLEEDRAGDAIHIGIAESKLVIRVGYNADPTGLSDGVDVVLERVEHAAAMLRHDEARIVQPDQMYRLTIGRVGYLFTLDRQKLSRKAHLSIPI